MRREALLAFLVYGGLTIAYAFPLSLHPGSHIFDPRPRWGGLDYFVEADSYLHLWTVAWDAHALAAQPGRLFDANILYPAPGMLAGSENLLGYLPVSGPLYWATHNPLLAAQGAMLASYVIGGAGMFLLARRWTARLPALAAGAAYAFSPWRVPSVSALNHLATHWWPFLLLALERYVESGSVRAGAAVTAALVVTALNSIYYGYGGFFLVALYALVRIRRLWAEPVKALGLAAAAGVAALLLVPLFLPYVRLRTLGIIRPRAAEVLIYPLDLLPMLVRSFAPAPAGLALGALGALVHLRAPGAGPRGAWPLAVALVVLGSLLSLGSHLHWTGTSVMIPLPYLLLMRFVPGFSSGRITPRWMTLASLGFALAVGLALEDVRRRTGRVRVVLLALLVAAFGADLAWRRAPVPLKAIPVGVTEPAVYRYLREHGAGRPLLELPVQGLRAPYHNGRAAYFSTFHWLPILNGQTGHFPATFDFLMRRAERLPDPVALQEIVDVVDLGWIVVHRDILFGPARAQWDEPPRGLERVGRFGGEDLYRVTLPPARDLRERFRHWYTADETLSGTPLVPLAENGKTGRLSVPADELTAVAKRPLRVTVRVENRGPATWPAYGVEPRHLVVLRARWVDSSAGDGEAWHADFRLPDDLPSGGVSEVTIEAPTKDLAGPESRLEIALAQDEAEFPPGSAPPLRLPVKITPAGGS